MLIDFVPYIVHKTSVDSTQLAVMPYIETQSFKDDGIFALYSDTQTQGKGSKHRQWDSPVGGLYTTIVIAPTIAKQLNMDLLTFKVALAINKTLHELAPEVSVRLKWPNDIICDSKKIGGVLIETHTIKDQVYYLIGIGLNLTNPLLGNYRRSVMTLQDKGIDLYSQREQLVESLIRSIVFYAQNGVSLDFIVAMWNNSAFAIHKTVSGTSKDNLVTGIFRGINRKGEVLIEADQLHAYTNFEDWDYRE